MLFFGCSDEVRELFSPQDTTFLKLLYLLTWHWFEFLVEVDPPGRKPDEFIASGFLSERSDVDETVDVFLFDLLHGAKNKQFISTQTSSNYSITIQ